MAITTKGNKIVFTGKDEKLIREEAKRLKLSMRTAVIGMLWEYIMRSRRAEADALRK